MFTGYHPNELSVGWFSPLDNRYPTLAEVLSAEGYATAGFVANLIYCSYEHGLNRGFVHYEDYPASVGQAVLSETVSRKISNNNTLRNVLDYYDIINRKNAAKLNQDLLDWLSDRDQDRPFFAFVNYFDAHEPYLPPPPFATQFGPGTQRHNEFIANRTHSAARTGKRRMSDAEIQAEVDAYDGAIAYMDHHLGILMAELEQRQLLDNTLVIVVSDHGEEFGEHGVFEHGNSLYLPSIHVPLLISYPGLVPQGMRVDAPATLRDLPATVLDLMGMGNIGRFPGTSLARHWQTGTASSPALQPALSQLQAGIDVPDWYPTASGPMRSLVMDRYHYIQNGNGHEELYDIVVDPNETSDLATTDAGQSIVERFRHTADELS
jgi:arylsulfatase A-like enzyme